MALTWCHCLLVEVVFSTLFTVEEMADGIVEPSRANSSGKATLDQETVYRDGCSFNG